jgi:hypothetical protein
LQRVVHDDAAFAVNAGFFRQLDVRAYAHRHDHEVGGDFPPVLEAHALYMLLADDLLGLRAEQEFHAALFERAVQHCSGHFVELAFHQRPGKMYHGDEHAALFQPVGRLQAQQPAADDDGVAQRLGGADHGVHVVDVAEAEDAGQLAARHRDNERIGTGGQQQPVVAGGGAIPGDDFPCPPVDFSDFAILVQRDAVGRVPRLVVQQNVGKGLFARQHGREQDTVVVPVRLGAEHGDVVHVRRGLEQFFERAHAGHAIADQYQLFFFHTVRGVEMVITLSPT